MDWNRLRILQAVAESGSFTQAGETLNLSQSAVSRQIAALEKSLGVVLFHRHSRGLLLTEQGEALYRTAREVSAKLAMTEAQIVDSRDRPTGPLVITTTIAFASVWLTPRLRDFHRLYPEIAITLLTSDGPLDLAMREADVAIRMGEPTEPDLIRRPLMTVHSHIYASPDYLAEHGPIETVEDLARQRLIVYGQGPLSTVANPNWLIAISGGARSDGRIVLEANNIYCMLQAVESGLGIASLPDYIARDSQHARRVLPNRQGPAFEAFFAYAEELRHSKRIGVFRDFLLNEVAKWRF
ncbi:MAG: LysR family transcriptional regulator [Chlorobiales bacterium]|nr:LysR family transcriptional regulator [Chlorobiales bacterium]